MFRFFVRSYSSIVPKPTAAVPDVQTFLTKIGRNTVEHVEHFPTWSSLFTTKSVKLKELGIDVAQRRYILKQIEKFRQGEELQHFKLGKKSYFGGERKRNERLGRLRAEARQERYAIEDAENK